jgi:hypothetical protein
VGAVVVLVAQEFGQGVGALLAAGEHLGVGPFLDEGAIEAFGLPLV